MTDDIKKQKSYTDQAEQGGKGGTSEATQEQTDLNQGNVSDASTTLDFESEEEAEETDPATDGKAY